MASNELIIATWILISLYAAVVLVLTIRAARRTGSMADYAVGSTHFSPVAVGLSLAASMTSAATFIINPGFIALYGLSGFLSLAVVLPAAAMLSLYVLTKRFRSQGQVVRALTMAQWMGSRYGSQGYAMFFAFLSLLLLTFIVLICVGLTTILSKSLNVAPLYVLIGIVVFVFGYMMFGGANAMVYTNTIQAVLMLVVSFVLLGSGYEHFSQGVQGFVAKLAAIDTNLVGWTNPQSLLFRDYFEVIFCQIVVGVAIVCQPHIITKSLILKEEQEVNRYLLTGMSAQVIFFFVVFVGLYARLQFPDLTLGGQALKMDEIMSTYVVARFPVYIGLVVVLGLIFAGLSTLEGLIQSLSTTITADILKPLFGNRLIRDEAGRGLIAEMVLNRLVIVLLGVAAVWLSYEQILAPNLSVGIFAQNGVYAYFSAAFVPVLVGIFAKHITLAVPVSASITAVVVHFSVYYGGLTPYTQGAVRNPGVASALAIVASVVVAWTVWLVVRKRQASRVLSQTPVL
ncbi:sodium:solute symporter family transporter [Eisenibacter elegans]|jgi:sodium/pantothenate symporter|uniref:sodium:solute symporter family transporter n=1 Tax=Eisenibacter elegans TaxID=997 RepID=UPI000423B45A|nr:sodium:solute symporter [Eisenibacter elegans]